jgi:hypothetical protein
MLSPLRNRFGIPGVISVIALVFAMAGGAYAAKKYVITSPKQIKPSVLKKLKGKRGPAGPAGPAGAQGPAGPAGAKGDTGAAGANGSNGKDGTSVTTENILPEEECGEEVGGVRLLSASGEDFVCNGEDGEEGQPWTAGGTLPPGATQTGSFAYAGAENLEAISFAIPLASALDSTHVHIAPNANCPGSVADPKAASGHLCVYVKNGGPPAGPYPLNSASLPAPVTGADKAGAMLIVGGEIWGTWAVTG